MNDSNSFQKKKKSLCSHIHRHSLQSSLNIGYDM